MKSWRKQKVNRRGKKVDISKKMIKNINELFRFSYDLI